MKTVTAISGLGISFAAGLIAIELFGFHQGGGRCNFDSAAEARSIALDILLSSRSFQERKIESHSVSATVERIWTSAGEHLAVITFAAAGAPAFARMQLSESFCDLTTEYMTQ